MNGNVLKSEEFLGGVDDDDNDDVGKATRITFDYANFVDK